MLWLSKVFGAKYNDFKNFLNIVSPKDAYTYKRSDLENLKLNAELIEKLLSKKIKEEANLDFEFCQKQNVKIIDITSDNYPYNLRNTPAPPPLLYYKGTLLPKDEVSLSIIGSRKYTEYGKACTKKFAHELSEAGVTIVSGMAYGIDSFSHIYSLKNGGRTLAVLGTGIDVIYPKENTFLYHNIIENGAVISEFPLHTAPISSNFPIRNRIVAGISLGTLVIEGNKKSGTMITARLAAEAGRNVYAVPGQILTPSSEGTNSLIKDGAKIVTCTQDILEDIYLELSQSAPKQLTLFEKPKLSDNENLIYNKLSLNPTHIDNLLETINLPFGEIAATLSMLELQGYIKELPGKTYVINVN